MEDGPCEVPTASLTLTLVSGGASVKVAGAVLAKCSAVVLEIIRAARQNASALHAVSLPESPWHPLAPSLDQAALCAVAAWAELSLSADPSWKVVHEDFLSCDLDVVFTPAMMPGGLEEEARNSFLVRLLSMFASCSGVPKSGCHYVQKYLLLADNDATNDTEEYLGLSLVVHTLRMAQFLRMEVLSSWCAAFIALAMQTVRRCSGVEAARDVASPAAAALRDLLGMPNEWPESCSGTSPF